MINGYYDGVAGLQVAERTQEVAAHNLANAETTGFKATRTFVAALDSARHGRGAQPYVSGAGVDQSQGAVRETGRALDIALEGEILLAVETPEGERYTRDGRLQLTADGNVVTVDGHSVLGEGGPIVVTGGDVRVDPDGTVVANGVEAGRLKLLTMPAEGLRPDQPGLLIADGELDAAVAPRVLPGYLEASNVDPIAGMVTLIETLRRFQAIAKANEMLMHGMTRSLFEEGGRPIGR